jgi:hypothetical protein
MSFSEKLKELEKIESVRTTINKIIDALHALDPSGIDIQALEQLIRKSTDITFFWDVTGGYSGVYSYSMSGGSFYTETISDLANGDPIVFKEGTDLANIQSGVVYFATGVTESGTGFFFNVVEELDGPTVDISDSSDGQLNFAVRAKPKEHILSILGKELASLLTVTPVEAPTVLTRSYLRKRIIPASPASGYSYQIDTESVREWEIGDTFVISQTGTGVLNLGALTGVTINGDTGATALRTQESGDTMICSYQGSDKWVGCIIPANPVTPLERSLWNAKQDLLSDSQIKTKYEANSNTNAYTDGEKAKVANVPANTNFEISEARIKTKYEANANTNAFTDSEKSKLAGLESSKFLGTYTTLSALNSAHPDPSVGSYAHVDAGVGSNVEVYIWDDDDAQFVIQAGSGTSETASSIKTKYESNPDTNAYTDAEKAKMVNVPADTNAAISNANSTAQSAQADIDDHLADVSAHSGLFATAAQGALADSAQQPPAEGAFVDGDKTKLDGIESGAKADQTGAEIEALLDAELGGTDWKTGGSSNVDISATSTETVTKGNLGYLTSGGAIAPASASAEATTSGLLGVIQTTTVGAQATSIRILGTDTISGASYTVGAPLYLATDGTITQTAPSASGNQIRIIGHATSATGIRITPDPTWAEVGLDIMSLDGNRELLTFVDDSPDGVNFIEIENEISGAGPILRAKGADANIDLNLVPKGTGKIKAAEAQAGNIEITGESYADAVVTATTAINWTSGNLQSRTLVANETFTFTAPSGPTTLILKLIQDATGSRTATWPATVKWAGGTAPTLTTAANAVDIVSLFYDGTNYHGAIILDSK